MNQRTLIFVAAVVVQLAILAGIPAKKIYTRTTGQEVVLKVVPVDPYDILKGYYVTLGYEISRPSDLLDASKLETGAVIYAVVEKQDDGLWTPVAIEQTLPQDLPTNRAALRGTWNGLRFTYGIEEFSIPESKREVIADDLNKNLNEARVDVKVDANGNAALLRLKIQDRIYE